MFEFLRNLGVESDCMVLEERSTTTHENAVESARVLKQSGIAKVILVTDGASLYRAERCFRRQGIEVVPAGCRYRATELKCRASTLIPSAPAADGVNEVFHEWLGVVWYWLNDRI
jgi:uncharacterized SAM-binding protein YcdF (DUF218 family)